MDITAIIPSRGRVRGLSAALTSLQILESRKHNVSYAVACDEDDPATLEFCHSLRAEGFPLAVRLATRPQSLGAVVNAVAELVPARVYTALCDDTVCTTPHWDTIIAEAVEKVPYGVFWWTNSFPPAPGNECYWAVVTEQWRRAAQGMFTEHYPYWFDDLCLMELWMLATDENPIALDIHMADRPVKTHRMRDLYFWREFFTVTRAERVENALKIAERLGLPQPKLTHKLAERIEIGLGKRTKEDLEAIEKCQGEPDKAPSPEYIAAKRRAERIMAEYNYKIAA
jgi:hypothetical protein